MRLALAAFVALLAAPAAFAEDAARSVDSRIARVTVYEDRALVSRTARASLAAGATRVAFEHLPPGLDEASIRARCGAARVLGVDLETVHLAREGREAVLAAKQALDAAHRKTSDAEMTLAEAKDRWDLLRSVRAKGVERAEAGLAGQTPLDVTQVGELVEYVSKQAASSRKDVLDATAALDAAKVEEDAARARLAQLESGRDRVEARVVVTLEAAAAGDADVLLQYAVANASWKPVYDLRVDEDFSGASLGLSAVVVQRTGEDWKDVAIELTTAQPSAGAAPPEPSPWRIWLPRPVPHGVVAEREVAGPPAAKAELKDKEGRAADALELELRKDEAFEPLMRRSGLVVAFESQLPASIASDGQPSRVALARFDMKPDVRWTAFPRATDKVFVTAKMTNATASPLPAGEARVFVGADYVGPMRLSDWGVGKEVEVGLGVDREVEVERERLKDERSTEGLFSKDTVHTQAFRITVRNHRDRAIAVRLLDQIPVSNDEDLEVKLLDTSLALAQLPPRDAETNKARGVLEWRFGLAKKGATDVRFSFEVRHPRDKEAGGLAE